jgi:hypothetical protein
MIMKKSALSLLVLSAALVACGGSGSGESTTSSSSQAATSLTTQGVITGFGSVIVNGVHYDVEGASITMDDDSVVESELEVGQMVRIQGSVNADGMSGKALKLLGETQLRGPIESIDLTAGVIVALGQTILINADTFYKEELTAELLEVGDVITVSSYTNDDGQLVATRIDVKNGVAASDLRLTGLVSNLDTTAMTFTINDQLVDYSKVTLSNLPNRTLVNGMLVSVKGRLEGDVLVAVGNLRKSHLGFKFDDDDHPGRVEILGLVSGLVANTSFMLGDTQVLINSATVYEHGTSANLTDGLLVKVTGQLDANNNLVASKVKFKYQPKIESRGTIESIDLTAQTFKVNGLTFTVTSETSFKDSGSSKVRFFDLQDLAVGDWIRVRAYNQAATTTTASTLIATRVERHLHDDDDFDLEFEGTIDAVGLSSVTISGKEIQVDAETQLEGFVDLASFLAVALGLEVEIHAEMRDGKLVATKIENESESESESESEKD